MKVLPVENRVLVKVVEKDEVTEGGLFIPKTVEDKDALQKGEVLAVGTGELIDGGMRMPPCMVGDRVLFGRFSGAKLKVDDADCYLLHGTEIMAVVQD